MKTGFIKIVFAVMFVLLLFNAAEKETAFYKVHTALKGKQERERVTEVVVKPALDSADYDIEIIDKTALLFMHLPPRTYN